MRPPVHLSMRLSWSCGILACIALALCLGCAHDAFTPPARYFPMDSTTTIAQGATAVQAEASTSNALTAPGLVGGSARIVRGMTDRAHVSGELGLLHVAAETDEHPNIYSLRAGMKLNLNSDKLALIAGLGGGYAPAGGAFGSVDLGVIVAHENCVLVPFGSARSFIGVPFFRKEVDLSAPDEGAGTRVSKPENTFGTTFSAGLKIPFDRSCEARSALFVGMGLTLLGDGDDMAMFTHAGLGLRVMLDAPRTVRVSTSAASASTGK